MPSGQVLENPSAGRPPLPNSAVAERQFVRFTRLQRTLHICMIVSFITLATTGLTLKFSYTKWAAILSHLLGGFESAGNIHRTAAIVMFGVFVTHLVDLYKLKKREHTSWRSLMLGPGSMIPNRRDLAELVGTLKWFVGRGERPAYGRWTYWEKFDYFAVFWGIAVIGSTGLTLWFPVFFTRFCPGGSSTSPPSFTATRRCWPRASSLPCISSIPTCGPKSFPWTSRYSPGACRWKNWKGTSQENMKRWSPVGSWRRRWRRLIHRSSRGRFEPSPGWRWRWDSASCCGSSMPCCSRTARAGVGGRNCGEGVEIARDSRCLTLVFP